MKRLALALLLLAACDPNAPLPYPPAPRGDVVDVLHGVSVPDPWRPLEDVDAPATKSWVEAENALTRGWLGQVAERPALVERLTKLWDYERWGVPYRAGGRLFVTKNDGLQNQYVLYVVDADGAAPRMLLDPNTLSADGTVALSDWSVSRDGKLLAYGLAAAGSDWNTWRVRDVATGKDLPDVLEWVKFSGAAWRQDGTGFWYGRYDKPQQGQELAQTNYFQKLCFHKIGTPQSADPVVYERPDHKDWSFSPIPTEDGRRLLVSIHVGTDRRNRVWCADLDGADAKLDVRPLLDAFDATYSFIDNDGDLLWFATQLDAPRNRVIVVDARHPERTAWRTLIPESPDMLQTVSCVGDRIFATYLHDARSVVKVFKPDGTFERDVPLPGPGSAHGFDGRRADGETWFSFAGFTSPPAVWRYDVATGAETLFRAPKTAFDASPYVTEQVFYASKDGTRVPMFLTHRKDLVKDGANPTYLYGYGGFNVSMTPWFSPTTALWLEMGGVFAVANLRGGGEYGKAWHEAGMRRKKQNVFDDFIAAAEWLVAEKWTSTPKLAIAGGSNGGLLVGACEVQRPDLFGACLPSVGVMDMLRFHKFTIGWAWQSDYGSPDDPQDFEVLRRYSPYHNVKPAAYPPTLVATGDHDDRVVPAHSFKFAAAMQAAQQGANPVLLRVQTNAGHGAGKPTKKSVEEAADAAAFLVRVLAMKLPAGFGR